MVGIAAAIAFVFGAAIAFVFGASVLIAEIVSASTDEHGGGHNAVTGFGDINTESPLTQSGGAVVALGCR